MPAKTKSAAYMREYRAKKALERINSTSYDKIDILVAEYKAKGLDRDDAFVDMIFKEAMKGQNAQFAKLYADLTDVGGRKNNEGSGILSADDIARIIAEETRKFKDKGVPAVSE